MPILQDSKEVLHEILKVQQILRSTSPKHSLSESERGIVDASLERSERLIAQMRKEVSGP